MEVGEQHGAQLFSMDRLLIPRIFASRLFVMEREEGERGGRKRQDNVNISRISNYCKKGEYYGKRAEHYVFFYNIYSFLRDYITLVMPTSVSQAEREEE